jgi:hypothetical protein
LKVAFNVPDELPPKKDGATSMWRKKSELVRIAKLRAAAAAACNGQRPLNRNIRLTLTVHIPENGRHIGDLDSFVAGVLDGLQGASRNTPWMNHPYWSEPLRAAYRPDRAIAIADDCEVVEISARKIVGLSQSAWYEVALEGE